MGYRSLSCFYGWIGSRAKQCSVLVCTKKHPSRIRKLWVEFLKRKRGLWWNVGDARLSVDYAKDWLDHYSSFMIWSGLFWSDLVLSGVVWSGKKVILMSLIINMQWTSIFLCAMVTCGMVKNNQRKQQSGHPSASMLLTSKRAVICNLWHQSIFWSYLWHFCGLIL